MSSRASRSRAAARRSRPKLAARVVPIVVVAILVALAAGFNVYAGMIVQAVVRGTLGYDLQFAHFSAGPSSARFENLTVTAVGESEPVLTAERLDLGVDWLRFLRGPAAGFGVSSIAAIAPHLTLVRRASGSFNIAPRDIPHDASAISSLVVHVRGGTVEVSDDSGGTARRSSASALVADGRLVPANEMHYTVQMNVSANGETFNVQGSAQPGADGTVAQRWNATGLPLAALQTALPAGSTFHLEDGLLRDVVAQNVGSGWSGRARVEGGALSLDAVPKRIAGAHGTLEIDDDGIAIPRLEARVGETPLHVAGVMRNARYSGFRWISADPDIARIGRLFTGIASQTQTNDLRLESLAPGVAYAQVATKIPAGPIVYNVLSVDQHEPTVRLDTAIAQDTIISHGERTSDLAARVGALAGLNGDYFDIGRTYEPQGILVRDGQLLRSPGDRYALAVHRDKRVTFALYHFHGHVRTPHATFNLTQVNTLPAREVTLITPAFGGLVPGAGMTSLGLEPEGPHRFRVTGPLAVGERVAPGYALVFGDESVQRGKPPVRGDVVSIDYDADPSLADVVAAVGGGPLLVHNGDWFEDKHAPAPDERDVHWAVDGVGVLADDSLLLFAVDGRHPERSVGMTRPEFGDLMRSYGVREGFALDSGGSVTMVSRLPLTSKTAVRNVPSDNDGERWISDAFFVFSDAPSSDLLARE